MNFGLSLLLVVVPLCLETATAFVQTKSGSVKGTNTVYNGKTLDIYLGIPYAAPPVGNLRFRRTEPVQPWKTPLSADAYPPACVQYFPYKYPWVDMMPGQREDCLYLNIWAPRINDKRTGTAVMFWIHGGGYYSGSSRKNLFDGRVLASKGDVIVVTVNYRLGVFGFLSTSSEEAPGNMGLYDILEALKWVKNNIQAFGGDPDNITLFGVSVGACTIGIFCSSPLAAGLFKRVILESGSPARLTNDKNYSQNVDLGGKLSVAVGCAQSNNSLIEDPGKVVECLRRKDARLLAFTAQSFSPGGKLVFNFIYGDKLLPRDPRITAIDLQLQDVDVLIGDVQDEGAFRLTATMPRIFGVFGEKNPSINRSYGEEIIRELVNDSPVREAVVQRYRGDLKEDSYDVRKQMYNSFGDYYLFCPTLFFAESYARRGSAVYYYYFNHRSSVTPWAPWMGVVHYSDVPFVFGRPLECTNDYSEEEKALSTEMIMMWTNFAKLGQPSLYWSPFSRDHPYVHTFSLPEDRESTLLYHFENCNFFRPIFGFP